MYRRPVLKVLNISKCEVAYGFVTIQTTYDVC